MARKTAELAEMNLGDLIDELRETKQEALNLRFRNATGPARQHRGDGAGPPPDRPHQHVHPPARDRGGHAE